jgi:hypothetical protein
MRKRVLAGLAMAASVALLPATGAAAQTSTVWLHVRVEEALKPSKVTVNLPLSVVQAALESAPELIEEHCKLHMGEKGGMKVADLRRVWKQLEAAGDAEFVTVQSEQEDVRIRRQGDMVQVFVTEKPGAAQPAKAEAAKPARHHGQVRVELPVSVVDALLSGEGEQLDVQAAVAELQKQKGDLVRVDDKDSKVRIWIDDQNTQSAAGK